MRERDSALRGMGESVARGYGRYKMGMQARISS